MNRRYFAGLLICGVLLVAVIPLKNMLSNPSADVDSSSPFPFPIIKFLYFNGYGDARLMLEFSRDNLSSFPS